MAYSSATFFVDDGSVSLAAGSDAVRATLAAVVFSNPAGTTVRGTKVAHGLTTGAVIDVTGCTQAYANSAWKITKITDDTFDLDGALWASFTGADVTGDCVPRGGSSWADAWATVSGGATAARTQAGDTIRLAKSHDPASIGDATWTTGPIPSAVDIVSSTNATPIVVTATAHGLDNGDFVQIADHETNTAANGVWKVANKTVDTFELTDPVSGANSVGNGVGGATGQLRDISCRVVVLDAAQTANVDLCEAAWTAAPGFIATVVINNGGSGYAENDILTIAGGDATLRVTGQAAGEITSVVLETNSTTGGYVNGTGVATTGGTGSSCTVDIFVGDGGSTALRYYEEGTQGSEPRQGNKSIQATLSADYVDGSGVVQLVAYRAISPGTLAAYQKLSLAVYVPDTATVDDQWRVCLCSDAVGKVVVDSFPLPAVLRTQAWVPLTIERTGGGNLGAATASIALYCGADGVASSRIQIDNIIAATNTGLSLSSLISKSSEAYNGAEPWFAVESINSTVVILDGTPTYGSVAMDGIGHGYAGASELVETYHRTPIALCPPSDSPVAATSRAGTVGSPITFSGGWDTSSGLQDGATLYDGLAGWGVCFQVAHDLTTLTRLGAYRYKRGFEITGAAGVSLQGRSTTGHNEVGILLTNNAIAADLADHQSSLDASGIQLALAHRCVLRAADAWSCGGAGVSFEASSRGNRVWDVAAQQSQSMIGISGGADNRVISGVATDCNIGILATNGELFVRDISYVSCLADVLPLSQAGVTSARVQSENHNLSGVNRIDEAGVVVTSAASSRPGGSGLMWQCALDDWAGFGYPSKRTTAVPFELELALVAVEANKLVTFSAWVKKSAATAVGGSVYVEGRQLEGVDNAVESAAPSNTSWNEVTVTFTPTQAGVFRAVLRVWFYDGVGSVTVDSVSVSQAV